MSKDRYPMCKDQPAQIDCRREECKWHKDGACTNVSPALTINPDKSSVCWSFDSEPEFYVNWTWRLIENKPLDKPLDKGFDINIFSGTKEECEKYIEMNKPQYSLKEVLKAVNNWGMMGITSETVKRFLNNEKK